VLQLFIQLKISFFHFAPKHKLTVISSSISYHAIRPFSDHCLPQALGLLYVGRPLTISIAISQTNRSAAWRSASGRILPDAASLMHLAVAFVHPWFIRWVAPFAL
jgi:hypothetical protein